jgi:hypothetical protein
LEKTRFYPNGFSDAARHRLNFEFRHSELVESSDHEFVAYASLESGFHRKVGVVLKAVGNTYKAKVSTDSHQYILRVSAVKTLNA